MNHATELLTERLNYYVHEQAFVGGWSFGVIPGFLKVDMSAVVLVEIYFGFKSSICACVDII